MEAPSSDSKQRGSECFICKLGSTAVLFGTSIYLAVLARRRPEHRIFLRFASAGMGVFGAANWFLRDRIANPTSSS